MEGLLPKLQNHLVMLIVSITFGIGIIFSAPFYLAAEKG